MHEFVIVRAESFGNSDGDCTMLVFPLVVDLESGASDRPIFIHHEIESERKCGCL